MASKYGNRYVKADGYTFDSQAEYGRYCQLVLAVNAKVISGLQVHPRYELQPAFVDNQGQRVKPIVYEADFAYYENGVMIIEDIKGVETEAFKLKWKLLRYKFVGQRTIECRIVNVKS